MEDDFAPTDLRIEIVSSEPISKKTLNECFGVPPKKVVCTTERKELVGRNGCHIYDCSFALERDCDKFFYVVERFCKFFKGDAHIGAEALFEDLFDTVASYHKRLPISHFALGAWTGLSGFIEKFSSTRAKGSRSIARIECSFHHDRRFLEIYFEDKLHLQKAKGDVYKLKVAYDDIKKIVLKREVRHRDAFHDINQRKEPMDVFLHVNQVSCYSWTDPARDAYEFWFDGEWSRQPTFGAPGGPTYCGAVGATSVIMLKLDFSRAYPADSIYSLLRAADVPTFFASVQTYQMPKNVQALTCETASSGVQCALACINSIAPEISMKIALDGNRKEIQELLARLAKEDDACLLTALHNIYHSIQGYPIFNIQSAVENAVADAKSSANERYIVTQDQLPPNLYLVKKVTVCPSRVIVEPSTVVPVNILLHEFDAEKVMLVDIRDDHRMKLRLNNAEESKNFIQAIAERIKRGIKLAGKTYYFLGNSKSQIDDSSFWAYAIEKKDTNSISSIRQRLGIEGDLATKVAAQDLVFAEALGCIEIDPDWITEENPSPAEDFKLGIGRISRDALDFIIDGCCQSLQSCCAIRVIHGGRKGTLVYDPTLEGNRIVYRKSQVLCPRDDRNLYLIGTNEIKQAIFDKVFISTLSSKADGVREEFPAGDFLTPVYDVLGDSVAPFVNGASVDTIAAESLLPHVFHSRLSLRRYDKNNDRFYREALRCKQLKALRELKTLKERPRNAFELMPVVDEAGVLEEGEVFVQLTQDGSDFKTLNSEIVIARKQAMHPAEILRVRAVDRPEVVSVLGHLTNCVVLPSKGHSRPLGVFSRGASYAECSDVIVIANMADREPKFLPKRNDRLPSTTISLGPEVDPSCDIETHFFHYLEYVSFNDFEEVFCAFSDSLPQHASSETCLRVAMQHRLLEEYRRGGRQPCPLQTVTSFPDFLGMVGHKRTYCSGRPLGHVSRKVKFLDVGFFENTVMDGTSHPQQDLGLEGDELFHEVAQSDLSRFTTMLAGIASSYRVSIDEFLSGTIFSIPENRFSSERIRNLEMTMRLHAQHLTTLCRRRFKRGLKKAPDEHALLKISAYWSVSRASPENGGYAFPWMFPDLMEKLIKICKPQPPRIRESELSKKLLAAVTAENERGIELAIMNNIFGIFEAWLEANKEVCALTRADAQYYSDKFTEYGTNAFEKAFRLFKGGQGETDLVERLQRNPSPLLAETLRQMIYALAEAADKKFSTLQFSMMHIQTLLLNTLIRIAAAGSLSIMLKPTSVFRNLVVSHRMLLPLSAKDDKYIRAAYGDLPAYEEKLQEFSSCKRVKIRTVPMEETSECAYEEFIATGQWFAVANLEFVIMQPDFRATMLGQFEMERVRNLNLNAE